MADYDARIMQVASATAAMFPDRSLDVAEDSVIAWHIATGRVCSLKVAADAAHIMRIASQVAA